MDNREISRELIKMSDVYNDEKLYFDNTIGEKIFGKIILNRIGNIAYRNLLNAGCSKFGEYSKIFEVMYKDNISKAELCVSNINKVSNILKNADFPYALLKGAYLITNIYNLGDRVSNDVDILINEKNIGACKKLLQSNGFRQGEVVNGEFKEASRMDIIMSKMNFGETIPFVKMSEEGYINVDINFSLDYKPMEDDGIITKMLENRVEIPIENATLVTLEPADFLIHLCLHLYKEATTWDWVERRKDLNLYKFNDIYNVLKKNVNDKLPDILVTKINNYGVKKECYYALYNALNIYGGLGDIDGYQKVLEKKKPEDITYLKEIVSPMDKKVYKYNMDFIDWFASDNRVEHLEYSHPFVL